MKAAFSAMLHRLPVFRRVLRRVRNCLWPVSSVSAHYLVLQGKHAAAVGQRLRAAWQDDSLPHKQRKLVDQQLRQYRAGARIDVFDVFTKALRGLPELSPGMSLLEIGCSSGFYSEVLAIAGLPLNYAGCDYSAAFITLAREKYPSIDFSVGDATALHYPDRAFDIAVSGCCLLHIPDYVRAVEETARVASRYAIFHRTPVVWGQPEQWYSKQAYGVETVEIHFNESEFLALLDKSGLALLATHTLHEESLDADRTRGHAVRTYVCGKKLQ